MTTLPARACFAVLSLIGAAGLVALSAPSVAVAAPAGHPVTSTVAR